MDFRQLQRLTPLTILSCSDDSGAGVLANTGGSAGVTSTTWPALNRAQFVPFLVLAPFTVRQVFWVNGATVNGNVDLGVYRENGGSPLVSAGSTVQSGVSVIQSVDVTDTLLAPGAYYMALTSSSGTATFLARSANIDTITRRALGMLAQSSFGPPLGAWTPGVGLAPEILPTFGISSRALV